MDPLIILTFVISLFASFLSGVAGTGGGFIMAPYWLLIGLSPAQAAANGSFLALGIGFSSLAAFKNSGHMIKDKGLLTIFIVITVIAAVVGSFILPNVDAEGFKTLLAVITIVSIPLIFIKPRVAFKSKKLKLTGIVLFGIIMLLGSVVLSSTFSILAAILLMNLFGMTTLQSTVVRRLVTTIQVAVIFLILGLTGNFVWTYALAGLVGGVTGAYVGTRYAIKKGERFARFALAAGALITSLALLLNDM